MAASNLDKFLKGARKLAGTIDSSGIINDTVDNFGLGSGSGVPTTTGVEITIDRADANGTKTPDKEETIVGVLDGDRIVDADRGVEGTAQAHAAGAVWEMRLTADQWNRMIDGILVEHGQDGKHVLPAVNTTLKVIALNAPRGFLINGKIVVTDADGITVAIKGLDGNDPSAANPVYCRIGDTIQAITAALSVAKADGTNWFNSGSTELAAKEVDYFVYLGYNTTDGVVLGFSRIPFGTKYNDFSATSTNEMYCAISTITTAAANDPYENIGRFAATLSGGAGYTWTVPTYTNRDLIQRPIFETRLLSWQPVYSASGSMTFGTVTTTFARYKVVGSNLFKWIRADGTTGGSASHTLIATAPFAVAALGVNTAWGGVTYDVAQIAAFHYFTDGTATFNTRKHDGSNFGLGAGRTINASIYYPLSLTI